MTARQPSSTVRLEPATPADLEAFHAFEQQPHVGTFIDPLTLEMHRTAFERPEIRYLRIVGPDGCLAGHFILGVESDRSVEIRRIVIDARARGIGQSAMREVESYCRCELGAERVWLDVYDDNERGKHVYQKLGYLRFKTEMVEERPLHFYEKSLSIAEQPGS